MDESSISSKKCDWSFFDFSWSYIPIGKITELDIEFRECNNRGERFEVLVEYLLNNIPLFEKYKWKRTHQTHDGKRDFEGITKDYDKVWGECKNYSNPISVNVISPTLVMSVIDGINTIYIFSLNKVNKTFKSYINKFSESSNKKVILFEDVCIENLIIDNINYVPEIKKCIRDIPATQRTIEPFSVEVLPLNMSLQEIIINENGAPSLQLNERFILSITVQNQLLQYQNIKISVKGNRNFAIDGINATDKKLEQNNQSFEIGVDIGEIKTIFVYCRLNKLPPRGVAVLPTVQYINQNIKTDSWIEVYKNKKIAIEKTYYVPLLEHSLQAKNNLLDKIQKKEQIKTFIIGSSGTGKSRLLKELYSDLLCCNQYNKSYNNIIYIDADSINSSAKLIQQMLLGFSGLNYDTYSIVDEKNTSAEELDNIFACVKYIINLDEKRINSLMKTIITIFNKLCEIKKSSILLFDNLQFADQFVIEIMKEIGCDYIYTVNTDYITEKLQTQFKHINNCMNTIKLSARNSNFVKDYLLNAFDNRINDIESLYNVRKKYTPLFLYHYIQYLMEEGIITLINNEYIINNPVELSNCRVNISKESDVIKKRIVFLINNYNKSRIQVALTLISVMGRVPADDFDELKNEFKILVDRNVAKIESSDYILTHQMISSVFRQEFLTDDVWTETFCYLAPIENDFYEYIKFIACFNSSLIDNNYTAELFDIFFSKLLYYLTDKQNLYLIFETVERSIDFFENRNELTYDKIKKVIWFYSWYSQSMQQMCGFDWKLTTKESIKDNNKRIFDNILTKLIGISFYDVELNSLMYEICREYFNRLLVKSMYIEVDEYTNQLISIIEKELDSDDKFFWLSMCYNRKSVALSAINGKNVEEAYDKAKYYSEKDSRHRNLVSILYDEGYRYYNDWRCYNKEIAVEKFKTAIATREKRTCIEDYQEALTMLLEDKFEEAYILVTKCLLDDSDIYDYYLCKMHILRSYLDFVRCSKNKEIQYNLKKAENVITDKFAREMQFHIYFLKGKYNEIFNSDNKKLIFFYYCNALRSYISTHPNSEQKEKGIPFYYAVIKKLNDLKFNNWYKVKKYDNIAYRLIDEFLANKTKPHYIESIPKGIFVDPKTHETYPSL